MGVWLVSNCSEPASSGLVYSRDQIFQRNVGILTPQAQELLRRSTVAIAGMGGPGGAAAEALARMDIGRLVIADFDTYEMHNINRQAGALHSTLGRKKTEVMCERLLDINPHLTIDVFAEGVTVENAGRFVAGADAVVDTVDYYAPEARLAIHREAKKGGQYVFSTPAGGLGALVLCFGPQSPTIEEFFQYPSDPEMIRGHTPPAKRLLGCELNYLPPLFWETLRQEPPYVSTNGAAVMLSGGVTAIQIFKLFLFLEQQRNPALFREYGKLEVTTVPDAFRIDGWGETYCVKADLRRI